MIKLWKKEYDSEGELVQVEFKISDGNSFFVASINARGEITLESSISSTDLEELLQQNKELFKSQPVFVEKAKPSKEDIVIPTPEKI